MKKRIFSLELCDTAQPIGNKGETFSLAPFASVAFYEAEQATNNRYSTVSYSDHRKSPYAAESWLYDVTGTIVFKSDADKNAAERLSDFQEMVGRHQRPYDVRPLGYNGYIGKTVFKLWCDNKATGAKRYAYCLVGPLTGIKRTGSAITAQITFELCSLWTVDKEIVRLIQLQGRTSQQTIAGIYPTETVSGSFENEGDADSEINVEIIGDNATNPSLTIGGKKIEYAGTGSFATGTFYNKKCVAFISGGQYFYGYGIMKFGTDYVSHMTANPGESVNYQFKVSNASQSATGVQLRITVLQRYLLP